MRKTKSETRSERFFLAYGLGSPHGPFGSQLFHFFGAKAEAVSKQQAPLSAGAAAESLRLLSRVSALVTGATPQNPYGRGEVG